MAEARQERLEGGDGRETAYRHVRGFAGDTSGINKAVALWIAAGANPKEVAARAGHTSLSFTLDRYGHLSPSPMLPSATGWTPSTRPASATRAPVS